MSKAKQAKSYPKWVLYFWLGLLIATPFVLWFLPASHFDQGPSMCPSVLLFDAECFGCGSTRAVQHFHHFEYADAIYYHSLAPFIYAFLVFLWFWWTYNTSARLGFLGEKRQQRVTLKLKAEAQERIDRRHQRGDKL